MIVVRMDPRLSRRVDASDVVQDTLAAAHQRLAAYLDERPIPFYVWLRQLAWNRLIDLHRRHIQAQRRSLVRENSAAMAISDGSVALLAERLPAAASSPSQRVMKQEMLKRVREVMAELPAADREILIMRHLEEMSVKEVAAALEVAEGTVKSRHFRALQRLRELLDESSTRNQP